MAYLDQIKKHLPFHNYVTNSSKIKDKYRPILIDALNGGSFQYLAKRHGMRFTEFTRIWRECVHAYVQALQGEEKRQLLTETLFGADGSVHYLNLTTRAEGAIRNLGIRTVSQLANTPDSVLLRLPNFGPKTLIDLDAALGDLGLVRNGKDPHTLEKLEEPQVEIQVETVVQPDGGLSELLQTIQAMRTEQLYIKDLLTMLVDQLTAPRKTPDTKRIPDVVLDDLLKDWDDDKVQQRG